MAPPAAPARNDAWRWALYALPGLLFVFAILFFFQTRDPMILIFGIVGSAIAAAAMRGWRGGYYGYGPGYGWGPTIAQTIEVVKVRCASCRALNEEAARFCQQCGKPM